MTNLTLRRDLRRASSFVRLPCAVSGALSASWTCEDEDSTVVRTTWQAYSADGAAMLPRAQPHLGAQSRGVAAFAMDDGVRYFTCVTGYDEAGHASAAACSNGSTYDSTPPNPGSVFEMDAEPFLMSVPCVAWSDVSDPHSSIATIALQLMQVSGGLETPIGDEHLFLRPPENGTSCHAKDETGVGLRNGASYYSRLRATNGAGRAVEAISGGFVLDTSAPTAGAVELRLLVPSTVDSQPSFPQSCSGVTAQVFMRDFVDLESGVLRCTVTVRTAGGGVIIASATTTAASPQTVSVALAGLVHNGTVLIADAACSNRVGLQSELAASELVVVRLEATIPGEVWVTDRASHRLMGDGGQYTVDDDTFGIEYSGAADPMDATTRFQYTWAIVEAPCLGESANVQPQGALRPRGVTDFPLPERLQARSFSRVSLATGSSYCGLVTVCKTPSNVSAAWCTNVTSSPVTIDTTAPLVSASPLPAAGARGGRLPLLISVACHDEESGITSLSLTLDTGPGGRMLLEDLPLVAPFANTNRTTTTTTAVNASSGDDAAAGQRNATAIHGQANSTGVAGTVSITAALLGEAHLPLDEGTELYVALACTNGAGLRAVTQTTSHVELDERPPNTGALHFASLAVNDEGTLWHGSPASGFPASWSGFDDLGTNVRTYTVCVGSAPLECDVEEHTMPVDSTPSVELLAGEQRPRPSWWASASTACFVTVTAHDGMGATSSVVGSLLLDWTAPVVGGLRFTDLHPHDAIVEGHHLVTRMTTATVEVDGGVYDDESAVATTWKVVATDGGLEPTCDFFAKGGSRHGLRCATASDDASSFCVHLVATNEAGLSANSSACLTVDPTPPTFAQPPTTHVAHERAQLVATWLESPFDSHSAIRAVEWAVCTPATCSNFSSLPPTASNVSVPLTHPVLRNYSGAAWVSLRAANVVGLASAVVSSNCVALGASLRPGKVTLLPRGAGGAAAPPPDTRPLTTLEGITATLAGWELPVCGELALEWCVGTLPGFSDLLACRNHSWVPTGAQHVLDLTDYSDELRAPGSSTFLAYATVTMWTNFDNNGLVRGSATSSNALMVDHMDPQRGVVVDGLMLASSGDAAWRDIRSCSGDAARGWACDAVFAPSDSPALRAQKLLPLSSLMQATPNPEARDMASSLLTDAASPPSLVVVAASWTNFSDAESGIVDYSLCYGSSPGADDLMPCTRVGVTTRAGVAKLSLQRPRAGFSEMDLAQRITNLEAATLVIYASGRHTQATSRHSHLCAS